MRSRLTLPPPTGIDWLLVEAMAYKPVDLMEARSPSSSWWHLGCGCCCFCAPWWGRGGWRKLRSCRLSTAPPARGSTAPPGGRSGSSVRGGSPQECVGAAPCAPKQRGRPAGALGTTWVNVTRGWYAWWRQMRGKMWSAKGPASQVRTTASTKEKRTLKWNILQKQCTLKSI